MAVSGVWWNSGGYDIHVIAGRSTPRLDEDLAISYKVGAAEKNEFAKDAATDGIRTVFTAEFRGAPPAHGIQAFNSGTGVVTVAAAPLPARHLRNFLIHAVVTDTRDGAVFAQERRIRVHVHTAVRRAWLTPSTLTIRRDDHPAASRLQAPRLTLLAEFDDGHPDGTIGDVTNAPGLAWVSRAAAKVSVDAASGALAALVDNDRAAIGVTLPASLSSRPVADVTVKTLPPWSTPLVAKLVAGSPSTGAAGAPAVADVPNIVFLPDGFTATEKVQYEQLVQAFVQHLRTHDAAQPYGVLHKSINYWRVWLPSEERGGTALYELYPSARAGKWRAVPPPVRPPAGAGIWTLRQLIDRVGLPVAADQSATLAGKTADWAAMYDAGVAAHVNAALFAEWRAIAGRRLFDERNTALAVCAGIRPSVEGMIDLPDRSAPFHPNRFTRGHLDDLLNRLVRAAGGPATGAAWGSGGKDSTLIVILAGGQRRSGMSGDRVSLGLVADSEIASEASAAAPRALRPKSFPLPSTAPNDALAAVAHECAHAFGLGDEYADIDVPLIAPAVNADHANLQAESSVRGMAGKLIGSQIRWRWHRIEKAAVLAAQPAPVVPVPAGARKPFVLTLRKPAGFVSGETIYVRTRPLSAGPKVSPAFQIDSVNAAGTIVTASLPSGTAFTPGDFPAVAPTESIVFKPRTGPPAPPLVTGPELMLVAADVEAHITQFGNPLNAPAPLAAPMATPIHVCAALPNATGGIVPTNLPVSLLPPRRVSPQYSMWIVGLYDGGGRFHCGVYHPAGVCAMRRLEVRKDVVLPAGTTSFFAFCAVCRYIMVDKIDPTRHGDLDLLYDKRYPRSKP